MIEPKIWLLYICYIVFPALGVLILVIYMAMERYWAVFNLESLQLFKEMQAERRRQIEKRREQLTEKHADLADDHRKLAGLRKEAVDMGISVDGLEAMDLEAQIRAKQHIMNQQSPRKLQNLIATVIAKDAQKT